jgi:hypothetical protein
MKRQHKQKPAPPYATPVPVARFEAFIPIAAEMKRIAKTFYVQTQPEYSPTVAIANKRAAKSNDEIFSRGTTRRFVFPGATEVALSITVDDYEGEAKKWHLSMSSPNYRTMEPDPVPAIIARAILRAFFNAEQPEQGPPEGAYKRVQHFRVPYLPD